MRRRKENTGRLIAHPAAFHAANRCRCQRIASYIDNARIDRKFVVHAATIEEDPSVGKLEQMGVKREAGESSLEV